MTVKCLTAALGVLLCAAIAQAQVKGSGTFNCAKPDEEHKFDIGPNHSFALNQSKCSADKDKPFTINGVKSGNGISTDFSEVQGNNVKFRGYYVDTMENGDKAEYSFQGTAAIKDGVMQPTGESWALVRATGKLKGAKGKGTCKGKGAADGSVAWDCEGEYTLASK